MLCPAHLSGWLELLWHACVVCSRQSVVTDACNRRSLLGSPFLLKRRVCRACMHKLTKSPVCRLIANLAAMVCGDPATTPPVSDEAAALALSVPVPSPIPTSDAAVARQV